MANPKNELIAEQQLQTLNQESQKNQLQTLKEEAKSSRQLQTLTADQLQSVVGGLEVPISSPVPSGAPRVGFRNPFFLSHF